jgi:hypothetical protein
MNQKHSSLCYQYTDYNFHRDIKIYVIHFLFMFIINVSYSLHFIRFITVLKYGSFCWNCTSILHQGWPYLITRAFKMFTKLSPVTAQSKQLNNLYADSWLEKHHVECGIRYAARNTGEGSCSEISCWSLLQPLLYVW